MNFEHRRLDGVDQGHETDIDFLVESNGSLIQRAANSPEFRKNEFVVYPAHGVGQITAIEVQTVAGTSLEFFVIYFAKSKMKARVPTQKLASIGIRKLSGPAAIEQARRTLSQSAAKARTNWARLAKEYETKIKSGEITALAEVVRDLHRRTETYEQSYSERQLYATALDRLCAEVALVERSSEEQARSGLESLLKNRAGKAA
jgi:CarD family transcriptional regulator, regulator of rRNA transcription